MELTLTPDEQLTIDLAPAAREQVGKTVAGISTSGKYIRGKVIGIDPKPLKHARGMYLAVNMDGHICYIDATSLYAVE